MKQKKPHRRQVALLFAPRVLVIEWAALIFAFWIGTRSALYWPLSLLILGRGQWTLMDNIGHWAVHWNLFRKKEWNSELEWLYFLPVFTTFLEWKKEHLQHHAHLGTENDPEWATFVRWKLLTEEGYTGKPYSWCLLRVPIHEFQKNLSFIKVWRDFKLCMFWVSVILMVVATHAWALLALWICAHFLVKPYFMFLSETFEHWHAPTKNPRRAYGSRMLTGLFFALYKPYGDQWHAAHHEHANIPPDQLKELLKKDSEQSPHELTTPYYFFMQVKAT